ncbi:RNA polymerases L / 13 to 16 kDa subunit [Plasmodium yoelii yoelii]|uniref:RNA polymerases L / 13 to 16 kDa subunit n=1 Tax=Plasmodium yoelii yoelii TaxID=73239 RepID=Q7RG92_PLAYO|nr:RNA polymerases L / 13 to 16 kDa subunit [Plasmodium yoelii yoelii]
MEENLYSQNLKTITHATFCFENEDHTLGNCLRCILLQKEGIEFAGYTVPHPTQAEINLRIQTTGSQKNIFIPPSSIVHASQTRYKHFKRFVR